MTSQDITKEAGPTTPVNQQAKTWGGGKFGP